LAPPLPSSGPLEGPLALPGGSAALPDASEMAAPVPLLLQTLLFITTYYNLLKVHQSCGRNMADLINTVATQIEELEVNR
jgi:CRISPR/Cas system CMR subunit Cmr4 (Cas7 group RAMP superfamily)